MAFVLLLLRYALYMEHGVGIEGIKNITKHSFKKNKK